MVSTMTPLTKMAHQIVSPVTIPSIVREAFRVAQQERPGPVHLERRMHPNLLWSGWSRRACRGRTGAISGGRKTRLNKRRHTHAGLFRAPAVEFKLKSETNATSGLRV